MDKLLSEMKGASLNLETLLEVTNALNSQRDLESLWRVIADQIGKVIPWDRAGITLYEPAYDHFRFYAVVTNLATPALRHDAVIPREGSAVGWVYTHGRVHIRADLQREQVFLEDTYYVQEGLGRMINLPLLVREHCLGTLNIGSSQPGEPDPDDLKFLQQVATQIAYAIDHVLAYQQIQELSEKLRLENEYLTEEVKASRPVLRDLLEEVDLGVEEEAEPRREVVDVEPSLDRLLDVGEPVLQRERELLRRRRSRLSDVVAGDRDRVPARHAAAAPLDQVAEQPHRR
ncbi:MAG TPA: GAF domain-containing protein, partial [Nitrospiraceae bacterium]|nr:GAF domain-containing protein [Nitrospiraceae bacterium]